MTKAPRGVEKRSENSFVGDLTRHHGANRAVQFENYPHPPIREAILDIFVTLPADVDLEALATFGKSVEDGFPTKQPRHNFGGKFKINVADASKNTAETIITQEGWIFRTPNKEKSIQARLHGFTFNRLPNYDGWAAFSAEAKSHWRTYVGMFEPSLVSKISLRYINRILAPLPIADFRDYCLLFPDLPKGLPEGLSEFVMQFTGSTKSIENGSSSVTVTFQPPTKDALPLILDVEVSQPVSLSPKQDDAIWAAFELLRAEKNIIFEASITDAARELFRK